MATIDITITVPDAKAVEIRDTITDYLAYQEEVDDGAGNMIPNPQSRLSYLKEKVRDYLRNCYVAGKVDATDATVNQARDDANAVSMEPS